MREKYKTHDDNARGQVGIGTLIVFIALVLVAAIAAGVLINTAGFLQSQAESTGEESTQQVSNSLQIVGTTGSYSSGSLDTATITVSLSPGSDAIDLGDASLQFVASSATTVTPGDAADDASLTLIEPSGKTTGPSPAVLTNSTQRMEIELDFSDADTGSGGLPSVTLEDGDEAQVIITTASGAQRTVSLKVPDPVAEDGPVKL
jgi:flagellin FlaB